MRELKREVNTPDFVPDFMATSLLDVDFKLLKKKGIKYIAFDADSTLVHYRGKALSDETKLFLHEQRKLFESWCIASNRITNDLLPLADSMDAQVIRATLLVRKPQKRFFRRVISHFGGKPQEIAMIGDKLVADIYGGKRSGLTTIWVEHFGRDGLIDRITQIRKWERRLLKRYLA